MIYSYHQRLLRVGALSLGFGMMVVSVAGRHHDVTCWSLGLFVTTSGSGTWLNVRKQTTISFGTWLQVFDGILFRVIL